MSDPTLPKMLREYADGLEVEAPDISTSGLFIIGYAREAADELDRLYSFELCRKSVDENPVWGLGDTLHRLRLDCIRLTTELHEARNVRRSDDQVGLVCATCGIPVETEPCPDHSPQSRA